MCCTCVYQIHFTPQVGTCNSAKTKTPWVFAFVTTGILIAMWSSIFVAWAIQRIRKRTEKPSVKPSKAKSENEPVYIIPPDPALEGTNSLGFNSEKARELFSGHNNSSKALANRENEDDGVAIGACSARLVTLRLTLCTL